MKKIFIFILTILTTLYLFASPAAAQTGCGIDVLTTQVEPGQPARIRIDNVPYTPGEVIENYTFVIYSSGTGRWVDVGNIVRNITQPNGSIELDILNDNYNNPLFSEGMYPNRITLRRLGVFGTSQDLCTANEPIFVQGNTEVDESCQGATVEPSRGSTTATFVYTANGCVLPNTSYDLVVLDSSGQERIVRNIADQGDGRYTAEIHLDGLPVGQYTALLRSKNTAATATGSMAALETTDEEISYEPTMSYTFPESRDLTICVGNFASKTVYDLSQVTLSCTLSAPLKACPWTGNVINLRDMPAATDKNGTYYTCFTGTSVDPAVSEITVDLLVGTGEERQWKINTDYIFGTYLCRPNGDLNKTGVNTELGCIPIDTPEEGIVFLIQWAVGIAGGVALLLLIYGSFEIITSRGDKYKLQSGKDIVVAAIAGLVLIIFAIMIYRVIAVDVLKLFQ